MFFLCLDFNNFYWYTSHVQNCTSKKHSQEEIPMNRFLATLLSIMLVFSCIVPAMAEDANADLIML